MAKNAKIVEADELGFTIETDGLGTSSYKFTAEELSKKQTFKQRLVNSIHSNMKLSKAPKHGTVSVFLWAFFVLGALTNAFSFLSLGKTVCLYVLLGMAVIHAIEANWVVQTLWYVFPELLLRGENMDVVFHWGFNAFLYGLPVTEEVYSFWQLIKTL
jgi:hypothetical protein